MVGKIKTLAHCLLEEFTANGGHFASPDTELWLHQSFGDFSESSLDILNRLITEHAN